MLLNDQATMNNHSVHFGTPILLKIPLVVMARAASPKQLQITIVKKRTALLPDYITSYYSMDSTVNTWNGPKLKAFLKERSYTVAVDG